MQHVPRALLVDTKRPGEFVAGNAVVSVRDEPDHGQPFVEPQRRVLEDRALLERVLLTALTVLALPELAGRQVGVLTTPAAGEEGPSGQRSRAA